MKRKITIVTVILQFILLTAFSQKTALISGVVKDESGEPLIFANILLGNGNGTDTDFDGYFSVEVPEEEESMELTVSYTGYESKMALWVKGALEKPMNFNLKAGIQLTPIVVVYSRGLYEKNCCSCCSIHCFGVLPNPEKKVEVTADIDESIQITAYPNPFISTLNVEMEVKTAQSYLFHLYNEAGQLVFAESLELEAGMQNFQLDLVQRHLPEGAYFLRISDDAGEIRTKRLVKVSP